MLEKEIPGQDEDHFITVDAVGCFEGDEEEEEDDEEEEEEEIEVDEEFCKQVLGGGGDSGAGWRLDSQPRGDLLPSPRGQEPLCWHL